MVALSHRPGTAGSLVANSGTEKCVHMKSTEADEGRMAVKQSLQANGCVCMRAAMDAALLQLLSGNVLCSTLLTLLLSLMFTLTLLLFQRRHGELQQRASPTGDKVCVSLLW